MLEAKIGRTPSEVKNKVKSLNFKRLQLATTAAVVLSLAPLIPGADNRSNNQDGLTIEPVKQESMGIKIEPVAGLQPSSQETEPKSIEFQDIFDDVFQDSLTKKLAVHQPAALNQEIIQITMAPNLNVLMIRGQEPDYEKGVMEYYRNLVFVYNLNGPLPTSDNFMFAKDAPPHQLSMSYTKSPNGLLPISSSLREITDADMKAQAARLQYYYGLLELQRNPKRSERTNII